MTFHVHDRRQCWDCEGWGIVQRAVSLRITEQTLCRLGWRFLEPGGRMLCSRCWDNRRRVGEVLALWQQPELPLNRA